MGVRNPVTRQRPASVDWSGYSPTTGVAVAPDATPRTASCPIGSVERVLATAACGVRSSGPRQLGAERGRKQDELANLPSLLGDHPVSAGHNQHGFSGTCLPRNVRGNARILAALVASH